MHGAAFGGHKVMVRLLLEGYKADIEAKTDEGSMMLHAAARGGNEAVP